MDVFLIAILVFALILALVVVALFRLSASLRLPEGSALLDAKLAELTASQNALTGRLAQLAETNTQGTNALQKTLSETLKAQGEKTAETLGGLQQRLKTIDEAQKNLSEISGQVIGLKQILSDKQTRGAYGQGRMETIIADGLPSSIYEFQATLSNRSRPDCLIRLPDSATAIVIDSKFPLEGFELYRSAQNDPERKIAASRIRTDVLKHVRDIAEKYLIAGETQDPAIMFVPSEWIYAELHASFDELIQQAHRVRVTVVSPNLLMLAVNTLQTLLKNVRMREQAAVIQREVHELLADVGRLDDRVRKLQTHFGQAEDDVRQILISTEKVTKRGERIERVDVVPDEKPALES